VKRNHLLPCVCGKTVSNNRWPTRLEAQWAPRSIATSWLDTSGTRKKTMVTNTTGNRAFPESKHLWREPPLGLSVKNFFAESFFLLSAKKFLKITFSPSKFFYHQHALIQRICSNLTQFYLCLLYLKILLYSR
jgi:hypothetical protein